MSTSKKPAMSVSERSTAFIAEETIRERAYELYEQRGREDGHALDDWLAAETEPANRTTKRAAA